MQAIYELLQDRAVCCAIIFLVLVLIALIIENSRIKSGKAMKKFIEEEEEYKRWNDTINDIEKPFYKKKF